MVKLVNEYLPKINLLLFIILIIMITITEINELKNKKENQLTKTTETTKKEEDNKIIIVSKDGILQILKGKEISIENLSPLIIKYQDNVLKEDGTFYLYTKDNTIYIFDIHNKSIIGTKEKP